MKELNEMDKKMNQIDLLLNNVVKLDRVNIKFFVIVNEQRIFPALVKTKVNHKKANAHITLDYECGLKESIFIDFASAHVVCKRRTVNVGGGLIKLTETGVSLENIDFGGDLKNDYYYHLENPRIFSKMTIPVEHGNSSLKAKEGEYDTTAANRWADPGVVSSRIGASPYQPFPAILLSNYETGKGIVHGSLSQKSFFHNYNVEHQNGCLSCEVFASFKAVKYCELEPGRALDDIWYLGLTEQADMLDCIFDGYIKVLKKYLPPAYGVTDINRRSLVWGSWNDGIFRDVDQERLLKNAEFIAENFPTVEWIQIDDGYAQHSDDMTVAHGLGMPYEGRGGVAKKKFPEGLDSFTSKIKETGLRPAVWMGGHIPNTAKLVKEHPDWGVDYSFRITSRTVLDVSKPEVRKYMKKALDFFFEESGFEGMKLDFWSYAFEDSHDLLENKQKSGYEWRSWWLGEIRKHLPANGYLQTGCDIVMANPFLSQYFTNYRYGIDIGGGNWDYIKTTFQWGAACFALQIGDLFVANSDAVGIFPGLTDEEAFLCVNFCLISRSMVELAGWLYKEKEHPRFKVLKKAVCCPNNGQDIYFAGYDYRKNDAPPEIWYFKSPHFSLCVDNQNMPLRTAAIFNLSESEKEFKLDFESLGLDPGTYLITDIWKDSSIKADNFNISLKPHSSILLAINSNNDLPQLLDADLKVESLSLKDNVMHIKFAFSGEFALTFSQEPVEVKGASAVQIKPGKGNWMLYGQTKSSSQILEIVFAV